MELFFFENFLTFQLKVFKHVAIIKKTHCVKYKESFMVELLDFLNKKTVIQGKLQKDMKITLKKVRKFFQLFCDNPDYCSIF